ncbi:DUF4157 domain-containing protein [Chitinophaga sp.]|uniref:eCIS core domain-containing protein n=1 Tax=Chitinophaga sp. TaxID=1869181 RepID=UPI0031DEC8D5
MKVNTHRPVPPEPRQTPFFTPDNERTLASDNTPFFVQTKLKVGQVDDPFEKEADATADKVMRQPGEAVQTKCSTCEGPEEVQRKESEEETGMEMDDIEHQLSASAGKGAQLPDDVRAQMEQGFGTDFSSVRVHDNSTAHQMNKGLGAQAFTHGSDIYFNAGKFDPGSKTGQHLLAHELTHVIQQEGGEENIQRECDPAVSSCPPVAGPPAPATTATPVSGPPSPATPVLARVQPISEADRATLQQSFSGAPLLNYINQRDTKRQELAEKNSELITIRPEHGMPEEGSALQARIAQLDTEIEALNNDILRLDNLVQVGLEELGLTEESQLVTLVNVTFPELFIRRAKEIAKTELDRNKAIVEAEADRYGYRACVDSAERTGLITAAQDLVRRQNDIAQMESILAQISRDAPSGGVPSPESMGSNYYDYIHYPERIEAARRELQQVKGGYLLRYPILARPNLDLNVIASGNEAAVGDAINGEVTTLISNIDATKENIDNGRLKVWNLRNIMEMTAADLGADENPDLMAAVNRHVVQEVSDEAAMQMALTALAITAAIVATVATAGGAAVVAAGAAGVGLGLSIGEAANSVQQYLAESRASDVALDPAMADISANDPDLTWVVMAFVGVILDVAQVRSVFNAVKGAARGLRTAEDVTRMGQLARAAGASGVAAERLVTAGSNQLLRLGLREAAEQVASAVALQAIANEFMGDEETELDIETVRVDLPEAAHDDAGTPDVSRIPTPIPPGTPYGQSYGPEFESRIEGMMRRGTLGNLPPMDHVIYGQYNRSGHGIDLIGFRIHPETGVIYMYRIEVKGGRAPDLGRTRRGPQMGQEWTANAIQQMMDHPRLRGLIERKLGYSVGASADPAIRQRILRRLRTAPSFIVAHSSAFLGRLGATLGGMRSRGSVHAPRRIIRVP